MAEGYTEVLTSLDAVIRKLKGPNVVVLADARYRIACLLETLAMPPNAEEKEAALYGIDQEEFPRQKSALTNALEYAWRERILSAAYLIVSLEDGWGLRKDDSVPF